MTTTIAELALILSVASVLGLVARILRQPMILAYLVVGAILSAVQILPNSHNQLFATFGDLGITFLLYLVGLQINVTALRKVGLASVILGLGQIILTFVGGMFIGLFLGLPPVSAAYIAVALTFSSTVIVVKLLSERQDMNSLYGKLSLGILLVQDVVAILILVILAGFQNGQSVTLAPIIYTLGQAVIMFGLAYWLGRSIMPIILQRIARSEELLFMTSLAWVLVVAAVVQKLGFSIEIGGFLAGVALANSSTHYQIASRVRPLRDFFIALFFIVLGSTVALSNLSGLSSQILIFSLFVLIGNPIIVLVIMGFMGYHRRTSFLTGVTVAQISEFSLVLAALGFKLGHISQADVTVITGVGVVTIALSSYMVLYGDQLYRWLTPLVAWFHRGSLPLEPIGATPFDRPILLIGAHRIGHSIAHSLPKRKLTILDSDPDVIASLRREKFLTIFGDSQDHDLLIELPFSRIHLIVSTIPNFEDNRQLLDFLNQHPAQKKRRIVLRADSFDEAKFFYQQGVDYVIQPQLSLGQHFGHMIAQDKSLTFNILDRMRTNDQQMARSIE